MNAVPKSHAAPRADRLWAFVFAGGATGAAIRAGFEKTVAPDVGDFPWPTLTVNAIGTFVLAWTATRLALHPNPRERAFLISGFCGGLTTFATMQLELVKLLDQDHGWVALGYAAASVAAGLILARFAVTHATRSWRGGP
jgi:CrcB protein